MKARKELKPCLCGSSELKYSYYTEGGGYVVGITLVCDKCGIRTSMYYTKTIKDDHYGTMDTEECKDRITVDWNNRPAEDTLKELADYRLEEWVKEAKKVSKLEKEVVRLRKF